MDNAGTHDALMIGGGQAGIPLAHGLAAQGMRGALAGQESSSGSCVNFGRAPTKAATISARVARQARRAAGYGPEVPDVGDAVHPAIAEDFRGVVS